MAKTYYENRELGGGPITHELATPTKKDIKTGLQKYLIEKETYGLFWLTRIQLDVDTDDYLNIFVVTCRPQDVEKLKSWEEKKDKKCCFVG